MIFSVQRFLEEHLERRGLADVDEYAIRAATAFERAGVRPTDARIVRELARVRTTFFRRNTQLNRKEFERKLAGVLRVRFKKKMTQPSMVFGGVCSPRAGECGPAGGPSISYCPSSGRRSKVAPLTPSGHRGKRTVFGPGRNQLRKLCLLYLPRRLSAPTASFYANLRRESALSISVFRSAGHCT